MIDFLQFFEMIAASPIGPLLYPLYILLVFLTTYYLALLP